ncbi:Octamer-binding transcription factor [Trema orientale]|uniref:Octamer-binding transcription factor n=1 Tax=Trema orientale TaxID=63057 RepID=A0A2P5D683_TREOI|nr:Octamer-binding transcription factor [Trema orientale]
MGEEVKMSDYEGGTDDGGGDEERVLEWEAGLPTVDDLTPLSQPLIPPELASAFSISPVQYRTLIDVNRASRDTLSSLRGNQSQAFSSSNFKSFGDGGGGGSGDSMVVERDENENENENDRDGTGSDSRKSRKIDCVEEADSALPLENSTDDPSARTLKRPRLVWTPQLHKRFVDVVAHLGIKSAVPKTIMQLMNVEGLTRENVASHLQKYRLYLKRMQGLSNEDPSSSDQLFSSTPVPQSLHESGGSGHQPPHASNGHGNGHLPVPMPIPYQSMMPMPVMGMTHGHGHMGMPVGAPNGAVGYHGFDSHPYSMMQQRDWSGNKYGSVVAYPHVSPGEK